MSSENETISALRGLVQAFLREAQCFKAALARDGDHSAEERLHAFIAAVSAAEEACLNTGDEPAPPMDAHWDRIVSARLH